DQHLFIRNLGQTVQGAFSVINLGANVKTVHIFPLSDYRRYTGSSSLICTGRLPAAAFATAFSSSCPPESPPQSLPPLLPSPLRLLPPWWFLSLSLSLRLHWLRV